MQLGSILAHHGEAVEADFQQFYGLRLGECGFSRMSRLLRQLPDEARLWRRLADQQPRAAGTPDVSGWSLSDQLLATIVDELAIANWQRGGGKKQHRPSLLTAKKRAKPKQPVAMSLSREQIIEKLARSGRLEAVTHD